MFLSLDSTLGSLRGTLKDAGHWVPLQTIQSDLLGVMVGVGLGISIFLSFSGSTNVQLRTTDVWGDEEGHGLEKERWWRTKVWRGKNRDSGRSGVWV